MDKYERAALRFANKLRRLLGKRPVGALYQGTTNSPQSCPIANTIGKRVEVDLGSVKLPKRKLIPLPREVMIFLHAFDLGEYQHLHND